MPIGHFLPEEAERRARARGRLDPRPPALRLDDLLDQRQADAGTLDLVARLERLEDAPDAVVVLGRDAGAVVANRELVERPEPAAADDDLTGRRDRRA